MPIIKRYPDPKPNIGYFRDRVDVKKVVRVENGRGGWTDREDDIGTFWAYAQPLSARNIVQYRQADMNVNTQFTLRMNTAIDTSCVFYCRGQRFIIESVLPDRQNRFLYVLGNGEKDNGGKY
jgi:SPP1 family predicted phage head-tail adaptor